jgi:hypothetical protein
MKKLLFVLGVSLLMFTNALAQKPLIDSTIYGRWDNIGVTTALLNNNGKYVLCPLSGDHYTLRSTSGAWQKQFDTSCEFSAGGKLLLYMSHDTLCFLTLGTDSLRTIPGVASFQQFSGDKAAWLCYKQSVTGSFIVINQSTGSQFSLPNATSFEFNNNSALVLEKSSGSGQTELSFFDLLTGKELPFWQGRSQTGFTFSKNGEVLAFIAADTSKQRHIWYYTADKGQALPVALPDSLVADKDISLQINCLNSSGDKLFFTLSKTESKPVVDANLSSVDVYSYKDAKLQSQQLLEHSQRVMTFVFNLPRRQLIQLAGNNEQITSNLDGEERLDNILGQQHGPGDRHDEENWNKQALSSMFVVSTTTGIRKTLSENKPGLVNGNYRLSPSGGYVIHYDAQSGNYFSYEVATGIEHNITKGAKYKWIAYERDDEPSSKFYNIGIAGWLKDDQHVLLYSQYDLFEADPSGKKPLINLTGNWGLAHHMQFSLPFTGLINEALNIDPMAPLLLKAFNRNTKNNAFCWIRPGHSQSPRLLTELPYIIDGLDKAAGAEVYTLRMQSAEKFPNYFFTRDFRIFTPLSDVQPQKAYNWLTDTLITFKLKDGSTSQGILYKPENFDPKKRYPVIIQYYERETQDLHNFIEPGYSSTAYVDIPTFVSNGYLIFCPDIHYKVGYPGRSACNTVLAAADHLAKLPWVDKTHMGLAGHSFGGFETDYIVTHSHRFAVAAATSGMTDFISAYGSIIGDGTSRQGQYELYRDRIGSTLWQRPDLYLENSPVLNADRVTTPILMMANHNDGDVPHEQGFEFFTALRRLEKKAWLLQYDKGDHYATIPVDLKDLSTRLRQFFDYYLKDLPPPKWMTDGIPARLKQVNTGLELDESGKKP